MNFLQILLINKRKTMISKLSIKKGKIKLKKEKKKIKLKKLLTLTNKQS